MYAFQPSQGLIYMVMKKLFQSSSLCMVIMFMLQVSNVFGQEVKSSTGPVFDDYGPVYSIDNTDFPLDTIQQFKAIFDVARKQTDPSQQNSIISSLHRYYNMHVRSGVPVENIHLAFVLHGGSTKDALSSAAYKEKYKVDNPNKELIETLSELGVGIYICGQSMSSRGYKKEDLLPHVKVGLSAMTVLTVYQMNNYAMIKF
jgi:intracellular sulfur oxidation DsrE/DsrF family protein